MAIVRRLGLALRDLVTALGRAEFTPGEVCAIFAVMTVAFFALAVLLALT